jgi:hypothetical protein
MRYNWNSGLKPNQNLHTFGDALSYFKECGDELFVKVNNQVKTFESMMESMADHRIYIVASDRTQYAFTHLQYVLRRYCSYNGKIRPNIFMVGKDANVPVNDPETDVGIVVSGSSFTKSVVNGMEVLADEGVKTFFLTYTTPEKAREEQQKQKQEGKELKPSVWNYFIKQKNFKKNFEERVIYLPMGEQSWGRERKRGSLAPQGTKFELGAGITAIGFGNGLYIYHSMEGNNKSKETPIETLLNTVGGFRDYLAHDLMEKCYNSRFEIADFVQDLFEIPHKKLVGFGESEINVNSFGNRLTHCEHLGKGKKLDKENRSVEIIKSAYTGFVGKNDLVIGISKSGDNPYTGFILAEAMEENPEKIYLITSHPKPAIETYTKKIVLPPIISTDREETPKSCLDYMGIYVFLDSCIAQLAENLSLDEEDMKKLHSRYG